MQQNFICFLDPVGSRSSGVKRSTFDACQQGVSRKKLNKNFNANGFGVRLEWPDAFAPHQRLRPGASSGEEMNQSLAGISAIPQAEALSRNGGSNERNEAFPARANPT